jgi:hypothetical protein
MKGLLLTAALALVILISCDDGPTEPKPKYTGITETSASGPEPIGEVDPDDWLIPESDTSDRCGIGAPTSFGVYPAYPNPTDRSTNIKFTLPVKDSVVIWVDDADENKEINVLSKTLPPGTHQLTIDFEDSTAFKVKYERILRVFVETPVNDTIPTVHGDVKYEL